jgi:DNA-binding GntR family transcriptional regulator
MCHIRAALESVAARLAAQKMTEDAANILRRQLQRMQQLTDGEYTADQLYAANTKFHELILEAADNPYVAQLLSVLRAFTTDVRRRALSDITEARRGFQDHQAICEAIASKNPDMAEELMRTHVLHTLEYLTHSASVGGEPPRDAG